MESAAAKENTQYLENNELNKLMETLMIQITTHKPADIVSPLLVNANRNFMRYLIKNYVVRVFGKLYEGYIWRQGDSQRG
jgi:hypothetical protein